MKILIIGGTRFIGRHLVNSARARGHEVTLFNRGQTNPHLFRKVETIHGDRERDLVRLTGHWEAAIDTCGYVPRLVKIAAEALKDKVERYVFISSVAVYADLGKMGLRESDAVATLEDESVEEVTDETYGPLKALCEKAAQDVFGINSLIIRPGVVVGPHDPTDRFTYWVWRIARGGNVLVPDRPDAPTQIIDVRDLSDFIVTLIEQDISGLFHVSGETVSLETVFQTCKTVSGSDARFQWAPSDFLQAHNVSPWSDMPLWFPDSGKYAAFAHADISKALRAGLKLSSLNETVKDTLEWVAGLPVDYQMKAGLTLDRERELLELLNVQ